MSTLGRMDIQKMKVGMISYVSMYIGSWFLVSVLV
jgi:hypothetical protein